MGDPGGFGTCQSPGTTTFSSSGDPGAFRNQWQCAANSPGTLVTINLLDTLDLALPAVADDSNRPERYRCGLYVGQNQKLKVLGPTNRTRIKRDGSTAQE